MILRPAQIYQMRLGRPTTPANFGGDSDSDSSVSTTNNTQNNAYSLDRRAVAQDSAVSLTGDGNSVDRSSTSNTFFNDQSNRSQFSLTSFVDSSNRSTTDNSNRSTTFTDNSNRSTNNSTSFSDSSDRSTHLTMTDYGSVGASLGTMGAMTTKAFEVSDNALTGTIGLLKQHSTDQNKSVQAAFEMARGAGNAAASNSAAVLGFASETIKKTNDAFAEAKDGGQRKMVMGALIAVAVVAVAYSFNK
jgi:hypothetical protein